MACVGLQSQAQYRANVWTADIGLPQNIVRGIVQTPDGYLWIATLDGLARFDGVRFTVFNKNNTPGISSNRFASMVQGRDGDLWLATESGEVTRYHEASFTTYGPAHGVPTHTVHALATDTSHHLWLLLEGKVVTWVEADGRFVDVTPKDLKLQYRSLRWENAGFWGWDEQGVHCFVRGLWVTYPLPPWLPGPSIWGAALDQKGALWLETLEGEHVLLNAGRAERLANTSATTYVDPSGRSWTVRVGRRLSRSIEYPSSGIATSIPFSQVLQDREANLWLGTEGQGLYQLQRQSIQVYSKEQGLGSQNIYPIYQDRSGAVWVGDWGSGLSRFRAGRFTNYTEADGLPNTSLTALSEDQTGRLWVGTHGGLATFSKGRFTRPTGPSLPERSVVQAIYQDQEGTQWFGTSDGLVSYKDGQTRNFTSADGLQTNDIRVIIGNASGDLWVGGSGGLTRIQNGRFTRWSERDGLPSDNVRSLYQDHDGILWVGTYDNGLGRLHNGIWTRYNTSNGLFNNGVFQILEDSHGNLWISCNRGIYRVSKRDLNEVAEGRRTSITSVAYGRVDGMLNVECNGGLWPAGTKTRDGKLWFPTQDGIAVVDPEAVPVNSQPPAVAIESGLLDRVPIPVSRPLRISPGRYTLEIEYTALSFTKPEQVRFQYRMEGLDDGWIDAGSRRTAYYSHLPPGRYNFRVIAANSDGVWNTEGQSLPITVLAPFYKTRWFLFLIGSVGLLFVALLFRFRDVQHQRASAVQQAFSQQLIASQESERKRIAGELHDSLGQRLVVINNLALFSLQRREKPVAESEESETLEEIRREASLAIEETRSISYNLRPFQLDRLGLRKALEGLIRTVSRASGIQISSEMDPEIDTLFPEDLRINFYRIVQEALQNTVKHAGATEGEVWITRGDRRVILSIHDNGRGFAPEAHGADAARAGFGLTGMAERAGLLGGTLSVKAAPGRGTTITVEIPEA